MTSNPSRSVLSLQEYKAVLEEDLSTSKPYSETGHLHPEHQIILRPKWFKGSRDRGIKGNVAA